MPSRGPVRREQRDGVVLPGRDARSTRAPTAHPDLAVVGRDRAIRQQPGQLVAARVGQTGDPEHLALVEREGRVPQVDAGEAPHFEHRLGAHLLGHRRSVVGLHLDAEHQVDELGPCVSPATVAVATSLPLRRTVTRSHRSKISSSRWDT